LAHPGVGIVMDSKGNVYYTDLTQIFKIDTHGKKSMVVHDVHSHELYVDSLDILYGEDVWYNGDVKKTWGYYVWKLSNGKLEKGAPSEGFNTEVSFVRDHWGNGYRADRNEPCQRVIRRDAGGKETRLGDDCLANIRWMSVTTRGIIYLIDFHSLKKIDRNGRVVTIADNIPDKKWTQLFLSEQHYLSGISLDKGVNIFIADYSGRQVKKITQSGKVSIVAETSIPWSPSGQLIAPNGDFWLLECSITNAVRVERISADGTRTVF
jgi:hypothetical protein